MRVFLLLLPALLCVAQGPPGVRAQALFPHITAVVNGASFQPGIVSGSWATILGTDLASTTRSWSDLDFVNGKLPPDLSSTGAVVNGRTAFVSYVSPTQVNVLVPDDPAVGMVTVQVKTAFTSSNIGFANKVAVAPALFILAAKYPVAAHNSDGSFAGPPNLLQGISTTLAHPGEVVQLFGTGFGPTDPQIPTGMLLSTPGKLAQSVAATVGGMSAEVEGYLIFPGVYQLNLTVPDLPDGDAALSISIAGASTQMGLMLAVAR